MTMNKTGRLIIFSGPSGSGKDTLLQALMKQNNRIFLSVSATTRSPRTGEVDGKDYFFLSRERFEEMIASGEMLEYAEYCGNLYGTPEGPVDQQLKNGRDVILEIEVEGAAKVRAKRPDAISIFNMPPSLEILEKRLVGRNTDDRETIDKRLKKAEFEMRQADAFDHIVVNDKLEDAVRDMNAILNG